MEKLFTLPYVWIGGDFELALDFGQQAEEQLRQALVALWTHPSLEGCYKTNHLEPRQQRRFEPHEAELTSDGIGFMWNGVAHLPNGTRAACNSFAYIIGEEGETAWLFFGVPMGALSYAYPVGAYPFADDSSLEWREEVQEWLRGIGETLFQTIKFKIGVIGWEASIAITTGVVPTESTPEKLWEGYLIPEAEALKWYPPTEGAPADVG